MSETLAPLRAAVVGLGWAGETHLKAYKALPGVEVVAIADADADRLHKVRKEHAVPYAYSDWQEMLTRDDIDVVSIATPNYLHMPVAVAALQSGKHVMSEKPLARSAAEAQRMVEAAEAAGRALDVSFNHRKRGDVQALRRIIDEGTLGQVYYAKTYWLRWRGTPFWGGWFSQHQLSGGGPLIDIGVHMLDMALFLMGEPEAVSVSASTYAELAPKGRGSAHPLQGEFDVEDLATAFIRMANGATLLLEASWAGYGRHYDDFGVELYGTTGGASLENREWKNDDTLRLYLDQGGVPTVAQPRVSTAGGHADAIRDFVQRIRSGDWAGCTGREGLKRSQIIEAAYTSAREGREVRLA